MSNGQVDLPKFGYSPFAHGPPVPEVTVLVAADSGAAYPVDPPPFESRLPYPRPRGEPIRYRAELMVPGEDFDSNIRHVSWIILPLCWLFMSIMFPFIFAMSLRNLGSQTKLAASFQIMSIVGGAIAPPLMGWLADQYNSMAICFILPLLGFIATTIYGFAYPRLLERSGRTAVV